MNPSYCGGSCKDRENDEKRDYDLQHKVMIQDGVLAKEINAFLFLHLPPTMMLGKADQIKGQIFGLIAEAWDKGRP